MGMRIFILFFFFLLFVFSRSLSATILKEVELTGNKRTTKDAIILHGQIRLNQDLSQEEVETIAQNLRKINQIRLKKIELKDGVLKIEIEEKWTLFPVPMITQSGRYYNRGFLIYEDNVLGSLGTLAPGISWSNNNLNALLYYQDESLFTARTGIKILLLKKSELTEFKRRNSVIDTHESRYESALITPNILIKDHVLKAGPLFTKKTVLNSQGVSVTTDHSTGLFFRHHWNHFQALDVLYEGLVTTYDLYSIKGFGGHWYFRHEADARWSLPTGKHFFNLGIHGHTVNDRSFLYTKILGGDEGFRGYDKSSVPASDNLGLFTQYQFNLYQSYYLSPFYEFNHIVLIKPLGGGSLNEHAVGIGLRYYFKKISIPAVLLDFSRNLNDRSTHFLLNIGASL